MNTKQTNISKYVKQCKETGDPFALTTKENNDAANEAEARAKAQPPAAPPQVGCATIEPQVLESDKLGLEPAAPPQGIDKRKPGSLIHQIEQLESIAQENGFRIADLTQERDQARNAVEVWSTRAGTMQDQRDQARAALLDIRRNVRFARENSTNPDLRKLATLIEGKTEIGKGQNQ